MKKILIGFAAGLIGLSAVAALNTFDGIEVNVLNKAAAIDSTSSTGTPVNVAAGKGIGSVIVVFQAGTNASGSTTFFLQQSGVTNASAYTNVSGASATIAGNVSGVATVKVDMATLNTYVRGVIYASNTTSTGTAVIQYVK